MELVNVNLYAEGYYSEATYEDNIWIKKSSYEKLKDIFPTEIDCGELDGKHSEVMGDVEIYSVCKTEEDYAEAGIPKCDGDYLEWGLKELYENNNLDWEVEQKEIKEYFDSLDTWDEITINIPSSKKAELVKYAKKLGGKSYDN